MFFQLLFLFKMSLSSSNFLFLNGYFLLEISFQITPTFSICLNSQHYILFKLSFSLLKLFYLFKLIFLFELSYYINIILIQPLQYLALTILHIVLIVILFCPFVNFSSNYHIYNFNFPFMELQSYFVSTVISFV